MPTIYREERQINASAETVFDLIANIEGYGQWNPWIFKAWGDTRAGALLKVKAWMYGMPATFDHRMIANERPTRFHWCDVGWFTHFVDGERERVITRVDPSSCRYVCELRVSGFGAPLANLFFGPFMRKGLKAEADALKQAAEIQSKT